MSNEDLRRVMLRDDDGANELWRFVLMPVDELVKLVEKANELKANGLWGVFTLVSTASSGKIKNVYSKEPLVDLTDLKGLVSFTEN